LLRRADHVAADGPGPGVSDRRGMDAGIGLRR
jgi:hypothetical protein